MIVSLYDYNARTPAPVEVPDAPITQFVRWVMETDKWRDNPEHTFERVLQLRKRLMAGKQPVAAPDAPSAPPAAE